MVHTSPKRSWSDQEYMQWLYLTYRKTMFYTANQYVHDPSICEDIMHDGIIKLLEKIDEVRKRKGAALTGYITATIRNTSISHLRHAEVEQKFTITISQEELSCMSTEAFSPDEITLLQDQGERLLKILQQLSHTEFLLLQGRYFLDYTDAELAAQLGYTESNVRMKLTRARRHALALLRQSNWEGVDEHDKARETPGTV